jgi:hypothetical protein
MKKVMYTWPTNSGSVCPSCGAVAHSQFGAGPEPPRPGDLSLCHDCLFLGVYDKKLRVRHMTAEENAQLQRSPEVLHFLAQLHQEKEKLS